MNLLKQSEGVVMLFLNKLFNKLSLFSRLFITSLLLLISFIAVLYFYAVKQVSALNAETRNEITTHIDEVHALYKEDGLEAVLDEYELEDTPKFDHQTFLSRLDEHEITFALLSADGELITGAESLTFQNGWHRKRYRFNDEMIQAIGFGKRFDDGTSLILQTPMNHDIYEVRRQTKQAVLLLIVFALVSFPVIYWVARNYLSAQSSQLAKQVVEVSNDPSNQRLEEYKSNHTFYGLGKSINQMLDEMTKVHKQAQTMTVGIAHDLKTPLSRVANRIQMMQQDLDDKAHMLTHIDKANSELQSIVQTFSNLIRLNEIESGKRKAGFKLLNVSDLVLELSESYAPVFEDAGKQLTISVVDGVRCLGDADLLNQLISNLLENALRYSEEQANVWIRLQSQFDGARLQIGDSGPGINSEVAAFVFERFYRADYSRKQPGNGLGLSIVKAICDLHDATITLLPNQTGAVFDIELPIER